MSVVVRRFDVHFIVLVLNTVYM